MILVGVDAGASHCTALVAEGALKPLARASGAPGALRPGAIQEAADAILDTVRRALAEAGTRRATVLVAGAAGAGREPERADLERALTAGDVADRVHVTTDIEIALVAAFGDGPGILLLAGTGSGACARLPGGEIRRTGGHGWQFGDEGGGYALARAALAAVSRASDGRGPRTALTEVLEKAAGRATPEALLQWARGAPRTALAQLAVSVQQAARDGDSLAQQLVDDAARDLAAHIGPLRSLFPAGHSVPVALAGGVVGSGTPMRRAVVPALQRDPGLGLLEEPVEPARGALRLAHRLASR